jgi:hypothetical protein
VIKTKTKTKPKPRQPTLKLPMDMPDGTRTRMHPFVWLMTTKVPEEDNKSTIAAKMDIRPQSLYKWEAACRADRNFPIPVLRAAQLADIFGVPPSLLRPDAFKR